MNKVQAETINEAIRTASKRLSNRQAGAVDDAIAALLVAGVPLSDVEILIGGGATVVRQRRGPPAEVGQHSGYYP